jgi:hypothetical protein
MSLIQKKTTPRLHAANRANSLKSTGPQTKLGKAHSSRNALKFGVFARLPVASMKELGEEPAAFEQLSESLRHALCPRDGFEQMLVEDMAEIRWRRQRLMRAEAGILAYQKHEFSIQRPWKQAIYGQSSHENAKDTLYPRAGLLSLGPSAENISDILGLLENVQHSVETEGFEEENFSRLKAIYGKEPSFGGKHLMELFDKAPRWVKEDPVRYSDEVNRARRDILAILTEEIACFRRLRKLCSAASVNAAADLVASQLIPSTEDLRKIMDYEAALERQFERKLQQLVAWRRSKGPVSPSADV